MAITKISRDAFDEEDRIVKYISTQLDTDTCKYIITRPGDLIWDKPSKKKLAASKSVCAHTALLNCLHLIVFSMFHSLLFFLATTTLSNHKYWFSRVFIECSKNGKTLQHLSLHCARLLGLDNNYVYRLGGLRLDRGRNVFSNSYHFYVMRSFRYQLMISHSTP